MANGEQTRLGSSRVDFRITVNDVEVIDQNVMQVTQKLFDKYSARNAFDLFRTVAHEKLNQNLGVDKNILNDEVRYQKEFNFYV